MTPLSRADAEERAREWAPPGSEPVLYEFELGWVLSARFPPGEPEGVPSMVLDRGTGELVVGGTLPPSHIAQWYARDVPSRPTAPEPRPSTMCRLTLAGRGWLAVSPRLDNGRPPHPAVSSFFEEMPERYREPGCERSAEVTAFSDLFWAEENTRSEAGLPPLGPAEMRELVRDARLETFRVRDDGDPADGTRVRPALPILLFLDYLGLGPEAVIIDVRAM
ncbi:YwqJ-related putative deaminase [Actinoplanes sp. CA-131856]